MSPAYATVMVSRSRPKNRYARDARSGRPDPAVEHHHVLRETAGADADEGDAVAVPRIHVRLDLEDEPREALVGRADDPGVAQARLRRRAPAPRARCRNGSRPKLVSALPKNTGVCRPARYSATSNGVPAARMTSSDSHEVGVQHRRRSARARADRRATATSTGARCCPCASRSYSEQRLALHVVDAAEPVGAADRPVHRRRGNAERAARDRRAAPSDRAAGRSSLLTKVRIGSRCRRQTSNSLRVCSSTPFAASMTMTTLSAAISAR